MFAHRTKAVLALFFLCLVALSAVTAEAVAAETPAALPRMVDLGAGKCIPCKKMAPILEEMQKDYAGVVNIVFVDVWKDQQAGKPYKIRLIPTQVFFDKAGKEVFRHEGFFSREDIEKVFLEKMGVKPIAGSPKPEEKKTSESLLPGGWDEDSDPAKAGSMSTTDAVG